jgi:hypothetical protein
MLFKTLHCLTPFQGKLTFDHPACAEGRALVVDLAGEVYPVATVAFVIPDDEAQGVRILASGYRIHTPMSMQLGEGTTHPEPGA